MLLQTRTARRRVLIAPCTNMHVLFRTAWVSNQTSANSATAICCTVVCDLCLEGCSKHFPLFSAESFASFDSVLIVVLQLKPLLKPDSVYFWFLISRFEMRLHVFNHVIIPLCSLGNIGQHNGFFLPRAGIQYDVATSLTPRLDCALGFCYLSFCKVKAAHEQNEKEKNMCVFCSKLYRSVYL